MGLMDLLERFVAAHEKLAEANAVVAQGYALQAANECSKAYGAGFGEGVQAAVAKASIDTPVPPVDDAPPATGESAPAVGWDPYTAPVMKVYKGEKQGILKAELALHGIDLGDKATGAQMHQTLLDLRAKGQPAASAPTVPVAPEAPTAHPITVDMVRTALMGLMQKSDAARAEALRLLKEVGGVTRLTDAQTGQQLISESALAPLYHAINEAAGRF